MYSDISCSKLHGRINIWCRKRRVEKFSVLDVNRERKVTYWKELCRKIRKYYVTLLLPLEEEEAGSRCEILVDVFKWKTSSVLKRNDDWVVWNREILRCTVVTINKGSRKKMWVASGCSESEMHCWKPKREDVLPRNCYIKEKARKCKEVMFVSWKSVLLEKRKQLRRKKTSDSDCCMNKIEKCDVPYPKKRKSEWHKHGKLARLLKKTKSQTN